MLANLAAQENISTNLARQSISGHRQRVAAFEVDTTKLTDMAMRESRMPKVTAMNIPVYMKSALDFSQGPMMSTGDTLNLAIEGKSFFKVKASDGSVGYTRNGSFSRQLDGTVTTSDGAQLLMENGGALQVQSADKVTIHPDGRVFEGENEVGRIGLAYFSDPTASLTESGPSRFSATDGSEIAGRAPSDKVVQGYLEGSNSNVVSQMVNMIQAVRAYESNQKAIASQDESTGKLIAAARGQG